MSAYETQISGISKSITTALALIREGTVMDHLNDFGYALWNIQGYLQGITLGQPTGVEVLAGAMNVDTVNRERLAELQELAQFSSMVVYGAADRKRLNPIQLIQMIGLIMDMLKSLGILEEPLKTAAPQSLDTPLDPEPAKEPAPVKEPTPAKEKKEKKSDTK